MKKLKRIFAMFLAVICLCPLTMTASAADYTDSADDATTSWYTSSNNSKFVYSKPMYSSSPMITAIDLGIDAFEGLTDIFAFGDKIYILDGATSRVVITDANYNVLKVFSSFTLDGAATQFKDARGIYADEKNIFICDSANSRLLVANHDGVVERVLTKPNDELWPNELNFVPTKMTKDKMGYYYVVSEGSYYGAIMYTPDFEFKGFYGANVVKTSVLDVFSNIGDLLFMNNTKYSKTSKALPFAFIDIELGADGYIFTCTGKGTSWASSSMGAIRRLNPTGKNLLIDKTGDKAVNSSNKEFGATKMSQNLGKNISHDMTSIAVNDANFIFCLDGNYGKIYVYDIECNLITTMGGGISSGKQDGTFRNAKAIACMGDKLLAIDGTKHCIIEFEINEYGKLVQQAQTLTIAGDYNDAKPLWEEVLRQDANSIIAYRGLAKACVLNNEYEKAMEMALAGFDRGTYSQAYEYVRQEFLAENFTVISLAVIALVIIIVLLVLYKKKKNIILVKNIKWKSALGIILHPVDTFYEIKRNNNGSVFIATLFLVAWYVFKILGFSTGFIFNKTDISSANAWYALAQTFGLAFLFIFVNWLVCVLCEGKGTLKQIYIGVCYSTAPLILQSIGYLILSNVLTIGEAQFITILNYVCIIYTAILLIMAIINIQEFSFGKFLFTTVVTLLGMILVVFLIFLLVILVQQAVDFVKTVFLEVMYR